MNMDLKDTKRSANIKIGIASSTCAITGSSKDIDDIANMDINIELQ